VIGVGEEPAGEVGKVLDVLAVGEEHALKRSADAASEIRRSTTKSISTLYCPLA
jgi:hypothetical protein